MKLCMKNGQTIGKDQRETWEKVKDKVVFKKQAEEGPKAPSGYMEGKKCLFRKGAYIQPYCLVRRSKTDLDDDRWEMRRIQIKTMASSKKPWVDFKSPKGRVPGRWVVDTVYSQELLPFYLREKGSMAVIPRGTDGLLESTPEKNRFWNGVDQIYISNAGQGGHTPQTLLDRLNYGAGLVKTTPPKKEGYTYI